jgi:hypothetical protein
MNTQKTDKKTNKLIIDEQALEELGLKGSTIYTCEYDMYSEKYLTDAEKRKLTKEQKDANERFNKLARIFRNKIVFSLKFKLDAIKHLESSWLLDGDKLDLAVSEIEQIKTDAKRKGFDDIDQRIKIIPIFTTPDGFENYKDKKAEFILSFIMEHVKMAEEGVKNKRMAQSTLWRCRKAVEICNSHIESMKGHERYNEMLDTVNMLDELNGQCEAFLTEQKQAKAKKKAKKEEAQKKKEEAKKQAEEYKNLSPEQQEALKKQKQVCASKFPRSCDQDSSANR